MTRLSRTLRRALHHFGGQPSPRDTGQGSPAGVTVLPSLHPTPPTRGRGDWGTPADDQTASRTASFGTPAWPTTASDERRGGEMAAIRRENAPGLEGPRDDDEDAWVARARLLHADHPHLLAHIEQVVRVAAWIAEAGRVYQRLTDHDGRVLMAAAAVHHLGEASGLHVTSVPAVDGTIYLAQRGARRLASLVLYHCGNEQTLGRFDVALTATLRPDPLHELLVLADLHVSPDGRVQPPLTELDRRLADPMTPIGVQQFLYARYHDLFTAASELERWAGRFP